MQLGCLCDWFSIYRDWNFACCVFEGSYMPMLFMHSVALQGFCPHQPADKIRFTHRLQWVTNYGFTIFSFQKSLIDRKDQKADLQAGHRQELTNILSVPRFSKTTHQAAFGGYSWQSECPWVKAWSPNVWKSLYQQKNARKEKSQRERRDKICFIISSWRQSAKKKRTLAPTDVSGHAIQTTSILKQKGRL